MEPGTTTTTRATEPPRPPPLGNFQIIVGVIVSVATILISWQTYRLSLNTEENNAHLKAIEQQLAENRFGFERFRDVYDRTEKYLSSASQNESRGKVLVVLIKNLPDSPLRSDLLSVVTVDAKSDVVAAKAADIKVGTDSAKPVPTPASGFSGDRSLRLDPNKYQATTNGEFAFTDSKGKSWVVPKGYVTNGVSVPRSFWSIFGSPLSSDYAIPVILHDYHVELRQSSPDEVNRMFYEAMRAVGVGEQKAKTLYYGVSQFGPRWEAKPQQ
jgi:uncharacterized protein DUF1353